MEKAYQNPVLCPPIHSLPLETLSRIILLATPDSFAFHATQRVVHPLSNVSRTWNEIIKTTPAFYSRIDINTSRDVSYLQQLDDTARRLQSWLAKARNTGLIITLHCWGSLDPDSSLYSTGPLHEMWMMLLSLINNWQEFDYHGGDLFIRQFWENAHCAQSLRFVSLTVASRSLQPDHKRSDASVLHASRCSFSLPKLQHMILSDFVRTEQIPSAASPSLQALTLRGYGIECLAKSRIPRFVASFPFLTKLRLEHVEHAPMNALEFLSEFKHLRHFELSQSFGNSTVLLSGLDGCYALRTLRLVFSAFRLDDKCGQLPSVNRLDLELRGLSADPEKLMRLLTLLPSLKYLKVSPPPSTSPEIICDARVLLDERLVLGDSIGQPTCPDLAELFLERATISSCDIACFIADRTFNATPATLRFLEDECKRLGRYVQGQHRNKRHAEWKPLCLVTTSGCPGIPDMVDAGLQALVDRCKSGELVLDDAPALGCDSDCACTHYECPRCEHRRFCARGEKYYGV